MTNTNPSPSPTNWKPNPKVTAAAVVGAIITIISFILQYFAHIEIPMSLDTLTTFILTVLTAYLKKS